MRSKIYFPEQVSETFEEAFSSFFIILKFFKKGVDNFSLPGYNTQAVSANAAIAQPVERILGKDEVASSNLASSSKPLILLENQGFFLFL